MDSWGNAPERILQGSPLVWELSGEQCFAGETAMREGPRQKQNRKSKLAKGKKEPTFLETRRVCQAQRGSLAAKDIASHTPGSHMGCCAEP